MEQVALWGDPAPQEKRCHDCHEYKPLTEYTVARENRDHLSNRCRSCTATWKAARRKVVPSYRIKEAARLRRYYEENRPWITEKAREQGRRKYARGRALLDELKSKPCMDCGGSFPPCCMDFDHRNGSTKQFAIAARTTYSPERLLAEIAKCDLVCSNCHRIRTQKRRDAHPDE